MKNFSVSIIWKEWGEEQELINAFLAPLKPFDINSLVFNWRKQKEGGFLLSPYPERIGPYSEADYEIIFPSSTTLMKSELVYLEELHCLSVNLRQKFGKYPNLRPSGFLDNYQRHPNKNLYLHQNQSKVDDFKLALKDFTAAFAGSSIAYKDLQMQMKALISAQIASSTLSKFNRSFSQKAKMSLPHGQLDFPIIGYRCFRIKERGDDVAIASLNENAPWKAKTYTEAVCKLGYKHIAPDGFCTCGLHSFSTVKGAIHYSPNGIVASIVAFGTIVQHDDEGFRAQKARIIGFLHPSVTMQERHRYGLYSYYDLAAPELGSDTPLKLAEKYEVPLYYSIKAMEYAAKEYGDLLPNDVDEPTFE